MQGALIAINDVNAGVSRGVHLISIKRFVSSAQRRARIG